MRPFPPHLLLLKGEDRTEEIKNFEYVKGKPLVKITFKSGKTYTYSSAEFAAFKKAEVVPLNGKAVTIAGDLKTGVYGRQTFGQYTRVIFDDGRYQTVPSPLVKIASATAQRSNDVFKYLGEIAERTGLIVEGKNILKDNYAKIHSVPSESVLADFLTQKEIKIEPDERKSKDKGQNQGLIYPFGFNISQKKAVENAFKSKVSVIEGPPGTGKTQTILNIVANAILNGKTVAVVSNNNTATDNVYEKLEKYGVEFFAAQLGNSVNKKNFIINQKLDIPNVVPWRMHREDFLKLRQKLVAAEKELDQMLEVQNSLATLKAERDELNREYNHFVSGNDNTGGVEKNVENAFSGVKNAQSILDFLEDYKYRTENGLSIGFLRKLIWRCFTYHISSFDFLGNDIEAISEQIERLYYTKRLSEIEELIASKQNKLGSFRFDQKMKEYTADSMKLFKAKLAQMYPSSRHKNEYRDISDFKRKPKEFNADYPLVLSTTYSITTSLGTEYLYDYVIVDEASQVDIVTGALAFCCAKNAVVVGDMKQLPPVVDSETERKVKMIFAKYAVPEVYRYETHSLLSATLTVFKGVPRVLLKEHYRCHPEIIEFCNKRFYNGELVVMTKGEEKHPLAVYRTAPGNHARDHLNERQMDVIAQEVLPNLNLTRGEDIGIVTPYRNQADALKKRFDATDDRIKSDTVDKFQGQERTVMIFSTVDNEIGDFVSDPNRLNVAVSRAERQFIVVTDGNDNDSKSPIHDLIGYIKYHNYEVMDSKVNSIFDNLYKGQEAARQQILRKYGSVAEFDSENLMYSVIKDVLAEERFLKFDVTMHVPLKRLFKDCGKMSDAERQFVARDSHVDFMIFSRLDHQAVLAVEVDGYAYHAANEKQLARDAKKDGIFEKYGIPLVRFSTTGSGEKLRLTRELEKYI